MGVWAKAATGCTWPWRRSKARWAALTTRQQEEAAAWFWFSAVLGVLPIAFSFLSRVTADTHGHPIRQGDLYLVAATLAFVGVGPLFQVARRQDKSHLSVMNAGGGTLIVGIFDAVMYAVVSSSSHTHNIWVDVSSVALYLVSAVSSLICVLEAAR